MTDPRPVPYPATTKSKGWRFEIDFEQVQQSDTWALAKPDTRPWLLMLWTVAWQQSPCGSMPADDELIIARLGIEPEQFERIKRVLLRGWWLAEDGRLYHDTIVDRVLDMLSKRDAERNRKAEYRARMEAARKLAEANAQAQAAAAETAGMSHGTNAGPPQDSGGSDATRTRTRTSTGLDSSTHTPRERVPDDDPPQTDDPTREVRLQAILAMKAAGLVGINGSHQTFRTLLEAGATPEEFSEAAAEAVGKGKGFGYALGIVTGRRKEAATLATQVHTGPLPGQKVDPMNDPQSPKRIEADGIALGVGPWIKLDEKTGQTTPWPVYAARVTRAREAASNRGGA